MRLVQLGNSGLEVSKLALGTWAFGGDWGSFDEQEAKATFRRAVESGVTLFDTAQGYGFGVSERLLGETLWEVARRDEVVVATKGGLRLDSDQLVRDASPEWLAAGVESSLRNLGTDYIDLYQVHWPDLHTPPEETADALEKLVAAGKIRHVGVSNYDTAQMDQLARHGRVETLQPPYHMFHRDIEDHILPYTATHGIGVLVYGPLAHGMLAGHMNVDTVFPAGDWRSHSPDFFGERLVTNLRVVERLKNFARARDIPLAQLAVAWAIANPAVDVAIVGARRPSQLETLTPAADIVLSGSDLEEIDGILAGAVRVAGPAPEGM
jgi:aryl-alcohol dehydrogenase-like predicted oxidoreductase